MTYGVLLSGKSRRKALAALLAAAAEPSTAAASIIVTPSGGISSTDVQSALEELDADGGGGVDLENAIATPTGLLGHDGAESGTVTPAAARTLLGFARSGAGAPSTSADFVGQFYINTTPNPDTVYQALGPSIGSGAADWTLIGDLTLAANQFACQNSGNSALEARTDKKVYTFAAGVTADGTYPLALWPNVPVTLSEVSAATVAGTCSIKIQKGGVDINGFGSAVAQTTSVTDTASTEAIAEDAKLTLVVSSASSLTGLYVTLKGTRTGA